MKMKKAIISTLLTVTFLTLVTYVEKANDLFVCTQYIPKGNIYEVDYNNQFVINGVDDILEGDLVTVTMDNDLQQITNVQCVGWLY